MDTESFHFLWSFILTDIEYFIDTALADDIGRSYVVFAVFLGNVEYTAQTVAKSTVCHLTDPLPAMTVSIWTRS